MKKKFDMVDVKSKDVEVKAFSVVIEPMYVGANKDKRLETVVTVKVYDPVKETFKELQGIVPPRSRLDQELKKLLELSKQ